MADDEWLAERFEDHRAHLRAVAYRMLGSLAEAEDAVQEAWLRLSRTDSDEIDNLGGWLTTVVGRVCLNVLRARRTHPEEPLEARVPDPVVRPASATDPEQQALLADSVGLALLVVLDTLAPPERLAFVLHDMFAVPFEDIAPIVGRTPTAARQLASRARRRVQHAEATSDPDLGRQWAVVDAFLAASREGDFEALLALLDPDVTLRADRGTGRPGAVQVVRGARAVLEQAATFARVTTSVRPALVNGAPGAVADFDGTPQAVSSFTIRNGRITGIDLLAGPRLRRLYPTMPDGL